MFEPELLGGNSHRIEEAETHRLLRLRVVTGRTHYGKSVFDFIRRRDKENKSINHRLNESQIHVREMGLWRPLRAVA